MGGEGEGKKGEEHRNGRGVAINLFFLGGIKVFGGIKLLNRRPDVIFTP